MKHVGKKLKLIKDNAVPSSSLCIPAVNPYNKHRRSPVATNIHLSMFDSTYVRGTVLLWDDANLQVCLIPLTMSRGLACETGVMTGVEGIIWAPQEDP